jgi:predicted polyphosphate/ATP-dependent NAD kinase
VAEIKLKVGLLLNPMAGVGGPVGLKGSDGVYEEAIRRGGKSQVSERVALCLHALAEETIEWFTLSGGMGADLLKELEIDHRVVAQVPIKTTGVNTRKGVKALAGAGIDLLLFAGGDGTARDVFDEFDKIPAALGIPCGVKMHSGVFATSPRAAAELVNKLIAGELLSVINAEIRDIDEASFREGVVKTKYHGELPVPNDLRYMQQTKIGGREVEALVVQEIAADFVDNMDADIMYIMGSGSTIATVMETLGLPATLLGIDVIKGGQLIATDATEQQLLDMLVDGVSAKIVVTVIGGQGHIFGRGNQQLSSAVIRRVGIDHIEILATKEKLAGLEHRPLLVDTGDEKLDMALSGMRTIVTGYEDRVFYRVA